jgi:hypothetical protein
LQIGISDYFKIVDFDFFTRAYVGISFAYLILQATKYSVSSRKNIKKLREGFDSRECSFSSSFTHSQQGSFLVHRSTGRMNKKNPNGGKDHLPSGGLGSGSRSERLACGAVLRDFCGSQRRKRHLYRHRDGTGNTSERGILLAKCTTQQLQRPSYANECFDNAQSHYPAAPNQGRHQQPAFIHKDQKGLQAGALFLIPGDSYRTHRWIPTSSLSAACLCGFWGLHPMECKGRPI